MDVQGGGGAAAAAAGRRPGDAALVVVARVAEAQGPAHLHDLRREPSLLSLSLADLLQKDLYDPIEPDMISDLVFMARMRCKQPCPDLFI